MASLSRSVLSILSVSGALSTMSVGCCPGGGSHSQPASPQESTARASTSSPVDEAPAEPAGAHGGASDEPLRVRANQLFGVLEARPLPDDPRVRLGQALFFEPRVSADGKVSCGTCHSAERGGADGLPKSKGVFGRDNPRNAPTVYNAGLQFAQHWRGDRESLEDQAQKALLGKGSFGLESPEKAEAALGALTDREPSFREAFPGDPQPVSVENWGLAIGAYERTLVTPAPFDAYLKGDSSALSDEAKAGLQAFIDVGCANCHDGALLGGRTFRKFGIRQDYASLTGSAHLDAGRFDVTGEEADRFVFKVPGLRNVGLTAPYFHDGSVSELSKAVEVMGQAQLGQQLDATVVAQVVAFLLSLDGQAPESFTPLAAANR